MTADHGGRQRLIRSRWAAIGAAVAVTLGAGGLYTAQAANDSTSGFVSVTPTRVLDTREATNVGLENLFAGQTERTLQVTGTIPAVTSSNPFTVDTRTVVPDGATAVVMNVTGIRPTHNGFISVRPAGAEGTPTTSNLNVTANAVTPNSVTVELSDSGQVGIYFGAVPSASVNIAVDIVGYYTSTNFGEQIDALTARVATLEAAPGGTPDGGDSTGLAALDARVGALETAIAALPTEAQQTIPGAMMVADDGGATVFDESCRFNERTDVSHIPLTLPVGAQITELQATVRLRTGNLPGEDYRISIGLEERSASPQRSIRAQLQHNFPTDTFPTTGQVLTLTPAAPVTIQANRSYSVTLVAGAATRNNDKPGLCNVTVTYNLPD